MIRDIGLYGIGWHSKIPISRDFLRFQNALNL